MTPASADEKLVEVVKEAGKGSRSFHDLQITLQDYAIGTLTNLDRAGRLFVEVERQCRIMLPPRPNSWTDDRRRLFVVSSLVAVDKFMKTGVLGGGWSPHGGSSLRSYCMRAALYEFATEYKKYVKEEQALSQVATETGEDISDSTLTSPMASNPETLAIQRDRVRTALQSAGPDVAIMLLLTYAGWKQSEIGQHLTMSAEAVSSAIRRFRTLQLDRDSAESSSAW